MQIKLHMEGCAVVMVTFIKIFYFGIILGIITIASAQRNPKVTITPGETNVAKLQRDNYLVSCKSNDNQQLQWLNARNEKIGTSEINRIRTEANSGSGLEIFFTDIQMEDAGTYVCASKTGRTGFSLTVVRPIAFDSNHAVQYAPEGRDYLMKCASTGHSPNLKMKWLVDKLAPDPKKFIQQPDGNLVIKMVTESDARRKFLCRAIDLNPYRPDSKDFPITLKVQMKPKLQGRNREFMYGVDGQWANLTCSVIAEPPARFEWYTGSRRLLTNNEVLITNQSDNVSVMQYLIRRGSDFGDYTCKAINTIGNVNQTITLKRAKKPRIPKLSVFVLGSAGVAVRVYNPPDTERIHDPASEGGTGSGGSGSGGSGSGTGGHSYGGDKRSRAEDLPVIGYTVQYKTIKKEGWNNAQNVTLTNYGFILRNLIPNVTYIIRAAASNRAATSEWSDNLQIDTPKNVPFNPPLSGAITPTPTLACSIFTFITTATLFLFRTTLLL